jgi:adenylate cyclase
VTARIFQTLVALILSALWATALGIAHWNGDVAFLDRLEGPLTDLRTIARGERPAPDMVTIVAIDDDTVAKTGGYPLARTDLAALVDRIAQLGPRVIAVDLLLLDRGNDGGDAALAQAFDKRPTAIAAAAVFPEANQSIATEENSPLARLPRADKFLLPLKAFTDHAAPGVVNLITDKSGAPRGVPMLFRTQDKIELSFPLRVAALAANTEPIVEAGSLTLAQRHVPIDVGHVLPLSFYGRHGTIRTISAARVLDGDVASEAVQDRIVVIGTTVTGGGDFLSTPFDPVMPGVEVVATAINHLVTGDGILHDRSTRAVDAVVAVALTLLLVGLLAWQRSAVGLLTIVAVVLAWIAGNFAAFSHGIWLSAALPVAAAAPPLVAFGAVQLWLDRQRAHYFAAKNELLQQFQAPALRKWLTRDPTFLLEPVHQDAAIVFIDLSGFTSLSETLGMDAALLMLKDFHGLIDQEVAAHGGLITSFLGDGAMILFGLLESSADDARDAVLCCVNLCHRAERWIATLPRSLATRTGFKVGAHFGPIIASRLGGGSYKHITATGDSVNVASRLMEVAAKQGALLAVSDELLRRAGPESVLFASGTLTGPRETRIRGRSQALSVWLWRNDSNGGPDAAAAVPTAQPDRSLRRP